MLGKTERTGEDAVTDYFNGEVFSWTDWGNVWRRDSE